jgi:hypothetical protein
VVTRPPGSPYPSSLALDICEAIAHRRMLAFEYGGARRLVQPYCHGFSRTGVETLRAVEVKPTGRTFGKLWTVARIENLCVTADPFVPDDPDYNPNDSAMLEIHCCVQPPQRLPGNTRRWTL